MKTILLLLTLCIAGLLSFETCDNSKVEEKQKEEARNYPKLAYDSLNKKVFVYDSFYVFIDSTAHTYTETYLRINSLEQTLRSITASINNGLPENPYLNNDLLIEKIWQPNKYPNSTHCNHILNSREELYVIDEQGFIQTYCYRRPSGEYKLVPQTTDVIHADSWRHILPSFHNAPPYSKIKTLITYNLFARTNWIPTNNLAQISFSDEVFGTLEDGKTFYTKNESIKVDFMIQQSTKHWQENNLQLIVVEDDSVDTKICHIDFVLKDNTSPAYEDPIGYVPTAEDFYYQNLSSKIHFDDYNKVLIRFQKRTAKQYYNQNLVYRQSSLADQYEIIRIQDND